MHGILFKEKQKQKKLISNKILVVSKMCNTKYISSFKI